jgi:hypothetical protein
VKNDKIVTINGRRYDKDTGLPIKETASSPINNTIKPSGDVKAIHAITTKSKAVYSHGTQKTLNDIRPPKTKVIQNMDISKSNQVFHFAPNISKMSKKSNQTKKDQDAKPIQHPIATKVEKLRLHKKSISATPVVAKSSKTIKQEAIAEALSKSSTSVNPKKSFFKRNAKYINFLTIGAVILIVAGYFIYINMPSISVRIASIQAGINATYPDYQPDGYSISGPISYSDGEVTIDFHANAGNRYFDIKQSKSSWDSSALKIQVDKNSNNETAESQESGLTIYTYNDNNNADWVNGGILYSITGNAKLSNNQIQRIATSL